ncbi:inositol hexakisphosphate kinase 1 isoform X2 [Dermatophagoides farinae]|uniref:inositol hexakisphosphate kinase 1 isoform X2 n=1 Tax=Dermatophagoides farinae TaxID=6954 RepID=UPI003F5E53F9
MKTSENNNEQQQCYTNEEPKVSSSSSSANNNDSTIELEPFIHQVGGRSTILVLGKYICKPINDRELLFYESIDHYASTLKPFLPQYHGTISVNFEESNDGYMIITTNARLLEVSLSSSSSSSESLINNSKKKNNETLSSDSPYQKFVTKYRIKLVRPIKEIIIESHEQDVEYNRQQQQQHVLLNLESANNQLNYILRNKENTKAVDSNLNHQNHSSSSSGTATAVTTTNLNRSRSTSISIPNFEDVGQNGYRDSSSSSSNNSSGNNCSNKRNKIQSPDSYKHSIGGHSQQQQQQRPTMANISSPRLISYNSLSTTKHNPWVLKTFSILSEFNESMKEQKFILLENLTSDFEYPCIMDLKMGTRLHDDHATQTKKQSHESKVNETTSGALGLRVTGIQIYDKEMDKFICYNKYYGRKLTPETFRSTLKMFVSNENFYNHHKLLDKMIERLQRLRTIIVGLDSFRFYTSSLLLIYEGNTCHCIDNDDCECCNQDQDQDKPMFDVRVIDFAHSTHANLHHHNYNNDHSSLSPSLSSPNKSLSDIQHRGYDEGFVYGLDNLIKILSLFRKEYNEQNLK